MIRSIYVHIPFCRSICRYCAFLRTVDLSMEKAWLHQALLQIEEIKQDLLSKDPDFVFDTVYFGGGTPSALSLESLDQLGRAFQPLIGQKTEWTVEANPESLDSTKIRLLKKLGVNRVSLGIQSFCNETLQKMGRKHSARQALDAAAELRKQGITNISADLIIAAPWQSLDMVHDDLHQLISLKLPHVSVYTLILEEESAFGKMKLQPADEDFEADAYELAVQMLSQAGYEHYEISSFALEGRYSRHNLAYWTDQPYYAVGYGAAGRDENGMLYHHQGSLSDYIQKGFTKACDEDQNPAFSALLMGLRTNFGVCIQQWNQRYRRSLLEEYQSVWDKYRSWIEIEEGRLRLSEQGREMLDSVLLDLLEQS